MAIKFLIPFILVNVQLIFVEGAKPKAGDSVACTRAGPICKDCNTIATCIPDADNKSFKYGPETEEVKCSPGRVCDEITSQCVLRGTCRYKEEFCPKNASTKEIIYPSPYSCNMYVGCKGSETNYYPCDDGIAYDPDKGTCSSNIAGNPLCDDYPVVCEEAGQIISISKYNYVCTEEKNPDGTKTLYPMIVRDGT